MHSDTYQASHLFLITLCVVRRAYGGPVDAGPEYETAFSEELNKLQRLYGSGDLTEFPEFKFSGGYIFLPFIYFCCTFRMIMKGQINCFFYF